MNCLKIYLVAASCLFFAVNSKAETYVLSCDISKHHYDIETGESLSAISATIERELDNVKAYITHVSVSGQAFSFPPIHYSYTWNTYPDGAVDITWYTSAQDEAGGVHYVAVLSHIGNGAYMLTESLPNGRLASFRCGLQGP